MIFTYISGNCFKTGKAVSKHICRVSVRWDEQEKQIALHFYDAIHIERDAATHSVYTVE